MDIIRSSETEMVKTLSHFHMVLIVVFLHLATVIIAVLYPLGLMSLSSSSRIILLTHSMPQEEI